MRTIHKYPLHPGITIVSMPFGAEILTVQTQRGTPCIWAAVNSNSPENRHFYAAPTGEDLDANVPEGSPYIGTVQLENGSLVYHVFEIIRK